MDWDDDDYGIDLTEEDVENIAFEQHFYELLAGTLDIEVIAIPDFDGYVPSEDELKLLKSECQKRRIRLLYRISNGKVAIVFDPKSHKVGIMPEFNSVGFPC